MSEKEVLKEVILGYRRLIEERYQYATIEEQYELPASFDEVRTNVFRDFFLNDLYPHPDKRNELEEAFHNLDNYIKNPEKLLRILIDSGSLILKYGRHLPKILMAGLKALKSFRAATVFEDKLVHSAINLELQPPYSEADIKTLLATLSTEEIEDFIQNNESLFDTLHDRKLVAKIVEIVEHLIAKMQKRPTIYAATEVNALSIGRDIIKGGDALFDQLSKEEQEQILKMIIRIETDFLEGVFAKNEN
ncbi:MAG: hypothetical protein R3E32_28375 [Chitinophagales bacterium]